MDFKALIEFNKYTLALSAACFAYALDKFTPAPSNGGRAILVVVLGAFFVCTVLGVLIFAAATSAQNPKKKDGQARLERVIEISGKAHAALLLGGLILLGVMVSGRVVATTVTTPAAASCPCVPCSAGFGQTRLPLR